MEQEIEVICNNCNRKTKIKITQNFYFCENNCTNHIFNISNLSNEEQQHIQFVRAALNNIDVRQKLGLADKE